MGDGSFEEASLQAANRRAATADARTLIEAAGVRVIERDDLNEAIWFRARRLLFVAPHLSREAWERVLCEVWWTLPEPESAH